jgi:hypothetical protein
VTCKLFLLGTRLTSGGSMIEIAVEIYQRRLNPAPVWHLASFKFFSFCIMLSSSGLKKHVETYFRCV